MLATETKLPDDQWQCSMGGSKQMLSVRHKMIGASRNYKAEFIVYNKDTKETYYSNIFTLMIMVFSMAASGDLTGATYYCIDSIGTANESIITYMTIYALLAYIAISLHMQMVKSFGSVAAVLVGNSRKTMTIMLSFIFFPKPFSWNYVTGGMLVLGSLSYSGILKTRKSKSKSEKEDMKIKGLGEGSSPPIDKKASNVV